MTFKSQLRALLPQHLNYFDWQLLKKMPRYIASFSPENCEQTQSTFLKLIVPDLSKITDAQSQSHLIACTYIRAAYYVLLANGVSPKNAIAELTYAFKQPGKYVVQWTMRIALWLPIDKRRMIIQQIREKTQSVYGIQFEFQEEHKPLKFTSIVCRCGYFDYFTRHNLVQLTIIFCEWDKLWADEIEKANCGVRFSRPTKLSTGDNSCRFEFKFKSDTTKAKNERALAPKSEND